MLEPRELLPRHALVFRAAGVGAQDDHDLPGVGLQRGGQLKGSLEVQFRNHARGIGDAPRGR